MRSLRVIAILSAWLCLSGRGVDAPSPPQTGTNQHNSFTGMNELIKSVLDGYKNLRPWAQQGIAVTLRTALERHYPSYRFATVVYDYNEVNEAVTLLSPGGRSGAITGPAGCDQAGVDPPWHTCRGGGSLLRLFAGSRAVDAQGLPTFIRAAVVFWWPAEEAAQVHVQGSPAQATQALKIAWWNEVCNKQGGVWLPCARGKTVPVDVTVMASCFARHAAETPLPRLRGFVVAPAQAQYDFRSGHIFELAKAIQPAVPEGPLLSILRGKKKVQIKLRLAALL